MLAAAHEETAPSPDAPEEIPERLGKIENELLVNTLQLDKHQEQLDKINKKCDPIEATAKEAILFHQSNGNYARVPFYQKKIAEAHEKRAVPEEQIGFFSAVIASLENKKKRPLQQLETEYDNDPYFKKIVMLRNGDGVFGAPYEVYGDKEKAESDAKTKHNFDVFRENQRKWKEKQRRREEVGKVLLAALRAICRNSNSDYARQRITKASVTKTLDELYKTADAGCDANINLTPGAHFTLAKCFRIAGNKYQHFQHLKKASNLGHPEARGMLGRYYWGSGLKSKSEIREYFDFTVKNSPDNDCKARYSYHVASTYLEESNRPKYFQHLKEAAHFGHPEAAYMVGAFYLRGIYCTPARNLARKFLERARDLGHKNASEVLNRM